jgi:hypothetical protein
MVVGAPLASLRSRLKIACLLYDRVYLEAGVVNFAADENGAYEVIERRESRWQTSRQRRMKASLVLRRNDESGAPTGSGTAIVRGSSVNWRGTLEPFRAEMPSMNGVDFVAVDWQLAEIEKAAKLTEPAFSEYLGERDGQYWKRRHIAKSVAKNIAFSAVSGSAVSVDRTHADSMASYVGPISVQSEMSIPVLEFSIPKVTALDWEDIAALRANKSIVYWRQSLRETSAELQESLGAREFDIAALARIYDTRLRAADARASAVWAGRVPLLSSAIGLTATLGLTALVAAFPGVGTPISLTTTTWLRLWSGRRKRKALAFDAALRAAVRAE